MVIRPGETLVYSTRWDDDDACHLDVAPTKRTSKQAVIIDERLDLLAQRQTLTGFLRGPIRSHAGASL